MNNTDSGSNHQDEHIDDLDAQGTASQHGDESTACDDPDTETSADEAKATPTSERDRLDAQLKRTMADLANIRKRHAKEIDEARKRAVEALSSELLPVLDNFEFALAASDVQVTGNVQATGDDDGQGAGDANAQAQQNAILDGLRMVRSLLEGTLERHGLSEIQSAGETFDPMRHEAVGVDRDTDAAPGTITKVVQRGYKFGDKILRASKVLVAGEGPDSEA